jgi:hypothetical protein
MDETRYEALEPVDSAAYEAPRFAVLSLDCEISAYAPDEGGDLPLF